MEGGAKTYIFIKHTAKRVMQHEHVTYNDGEMNKWPSADETRVVGCSGWNPMSAVLGRRAAVTAKFR